MLDELAVYRGPFQELMRLWRMFLIKLPRSMKPRNLFMSDEELVIIANNRDNDDIYRSIMNGSTNADGSLFQFNRIPVYRRE